MCMLLHSVDQWCYKPAVYHIWAPIKHQSMWNITCCMLANLHRVVVQYLQLAAVASALVSSLWASLVVGTQTGVGRGPRSAEAASPASRYRPLLLLMKTDYYINKILCGLKMLGLVVSWLVLLVHRWLHPPLCSFITTAASTFDFIAGAFCPRSLSLHLRNPSKIYVCVDLA